MLRVGRVLWVSSVLCVFWGLRLLFVLIVLWWTLWALNISVINVTIDKGLLNVASVVSVMTLMGVENVVEIICARDDLRVLWKECV